ncbi:hypothetical protein B5807_10793 [Epicoccum nigrum]|uniref:Uncharacterized protein n=1 Tax=Epicoccum nigrum TaxID=105696 RepID=A0A1Y2LMY4_EPING|nr:hypothetical protein B5807_10793 [Epicoccum nigrum]
MHEANVMSSCLEAPACDSHPATLFGKLPSLQIQCTTQLSPLFHRHPADNNNDNNKNQNTEEELHKMPFLTGSEGDTSLSWDGFTYPAADLSSWKLDPDCIPEAGGIPDSRFVRVSREQRNGYGLSQSDNTLPAPLLKETKAPLSSAETRSTSVPCATESSRAPTEGKVTSTAVGGWPTPVPRACRASSHGSRTGEPSLSRPTIPANSKGLEPTFEATSTCVQSLKGTMEILFAPSSLEAATTARSMPPHLRKRQPTSTHQWRNLICMILPAG